MAIEIFVFHDDAVVEYGNDTIHVTRAQMKFNIEAMNWPFCGDDHLLEVNLDIKVPGDKPPKSFGEKRRGPGGGSAVGKIGESALREVRVPEVDLGAVHSGAGPKRCVAEFLRGAFSI